MTKSVFVALLSLVVLASPSRALTVRRKFTCEAIERRVAIAQLIRLARLTAGSV
jgi:hypothetical protein